MSENVSRRRFFQIGAGVTAGAGVGCGNEMSGFSDLLKQGYVDRKLTDFSSPTGESIDLITHALNRLSFGPSPGDYDHIKQLGEKEDEAVEAYIEEQLDPKELSDLTGKQLTLSFEYQEHTPGDHFNFNHQKLLEDMVRYSLMHATKTNRQLHEIMVHFWSDHFNIDSSKGDCKWLTASHDRDVIRKQALGSFSELLRKTALSPAMLWYLDGRVNRKDDSEDRPNENYARELLELHTLGVDGGYTQKDVMEAARVLTGWTVKDRGKLWGPGSVEFKKHRHDDGEKTVLGKKIPAGRGKEDLDLLLEIVAHHPSTARYIATKLCTRFIADTPPSAAIDEVAKSFLDSKGDIKQVLRTLFKTTAFRETRGNKLKRPFHFLVSSLRATGAKTDAQRALTRFLERMGNTPFHYPTPDGYPEEADPWMSTMLWRWNFAIRFSRNRIKGTRCKPGDLVDLAGGQENLVRWFLGRSPDKAELAALEACPEEDRLALVLGSPAFQLF